MSDTFVQMFRHNRWANLRLLDACAELSGEQFGATVHGTMGSIEKLLQHIAGAEERYVNALRQGPGQLPPREREPFQGVPALRDALAASGDALIELAAATPDGTIVRGVRRGEPFELPAWLFFVQAVNHGTEHRSQVATILTQQGVEPPEMDGWTYQAEVAATT